MVSPISMQVDGSSRNVRPPMTSFSPSIWADTFTNFKYDPLEQEKYGEAIEALKKETRSKLLAAKSGELIKLTDIIVRLGLAYHFETEIKEKIETIYNDFNGARMQTMTCVFEKFKDEENKFKESVKNDVEGLLSLYEAAHIRVHGEDILEEAVAFTTHHLKLILSQGLIVISPGLQDKVTRALDQPHCRGARITEIRVYISTYENDIESRDESFLKLSKLNFNFLQNLYKKEICELTGWWNKFDLKSKLTYARDILVECYFWGVCFNFEPEYSYVRKMTAISAQMATIMDDTYDNYGTLEENQLFTDVLERWDMNEIDILPDYMKTVFQFVVSIYEDVERDAAEQGKSFAAPYFKEAIQQLGRAYNKEQIWTMERQMPPLEEYVTNSVITSCIFVMLTSILPGIKSATKQTADWLMSWPQILISTAKLGRLLDDLASQEVPREREGKLLTVVDCYMKEHPGVSKQATLAKFREGVENRWKDIIHNMKEKAKWVDPGTNEMVELFLNYARNASVTYKDSDGFSNPEKSWAPQIAATFVDPIVI
ncbi:hypothetical protein CASFOL_006373 [Castilleja foliolosa]|uniref:Uncharacterized protein n=1 Tax=Castilleja foliolosa TaxID=1961234 RepID=A0ABD3E666_9LAMI